VLRILWPAWLSLQFATPASAQLAAEGRTLAAERVAPIGVLLVATDASGFPERAGGQLSDLPVRVSVAASPSREPSSWQARELRARQLSRQHAADVVAWLQSDAAAPDAAAPDAAAPDAPAPGAARAAYLVTFVAATGELRARRIGEAWPGLSDEARSAALEVAALALRSTLRSLVLERSALAAPPPPEPPRELIVERAEPVRWVTGWGLGWSVNGQSPLGSAGLLIELGMARGPWSWGACGRLGLPSSVVAGDAELSVRQHAAAAELGYRLGTGRWSLAPLLRAGVTITSRQARASASNVVLTDDDTHVGPLLAAGLGADLRVFSGQRLRLSLLALWQPDAPSYVLQRSSSEDASVASLWNVQPSVELGWAVLW
jgi:hypothetical protein